MRLKKAGELHDFVHHGGFAVVDVGDDGDITKGCFRLRIHRGGLWDGIEVDKAHPNANSK
jgi:hypothetical protein